MRAIESALGDAYSEPAADVRGFIALGEAGRLVAHSARS